LAKQVTVHNPMRIASLVTICMIHPMNFSYDMIPKIHACNAIKILWRR
jgi:hypothetical protein